VSISALPMTASELAADLRKCLSIASRERDREAAQAGSQAWFTLIKSAAAATLTEGGEEKMLTCLIKVRETTMWVCHLWSLWVLFLSCKQAYSLTIHNVSMI
jgi:hypothetical protein